MRWAGASIVFQGAMHSLNPVHRIGDQIAEPILLHDAGRRRRAARTRVGELLEQVGLPGARAAAYPHELSGGQRQRVMIAMALACDPRLIIADEPTTALDVMIQAQILRLIEQLVAEQDVGLIMISHDLAVLADTCDRLAVMYAGRVVEEGPAAAGLRGRPAPLRRAPCRRPSRESATRPPGSPRAAWPAIRPTRPHCRPAARSIRAVRRRWHVCATAGPGTAGRAAPDRQAACVHVGPTVPGPAVAAEDARSAT